MVLWNYAEKIQQVLSIESDLKIGPVILAGNAFFALTHLYGRGKNADLALRKLHADSSRPLIGELRYAFDCRFNLVLLQLGCYRMVLVQHALVGGEICST